MKMAATLSTAVLGASTALAAPCTERHAWEGQTREVIEMQLAGALESHGVNVQGIIVFPAGNKYRAPLLLGLARNIPALEEKSAELRAAMRDEQTRSNSCVRVQ